MHRLIWLLAVAALILAACSGAPAATTPGSQATEPPGATSTPGSGEQTEPGGTTPQPNTGDNKAKAQALIPTGCSQISEFTSGGNYTVSLSCTQTVEQMAAFWTTAIPAAGLTESGRFSAAGTLTIAFTNPDGGITAAADTSTNTTVVTISVGTSG
jgi:hypothetical protein